ncbi:MAG: hypothetical protein FJ125_16010, partial [Deltaproteobacteria bacterium]|nr:hypothetical protein [Deltaproteobacteria bacterium]
MPRHLLLRWLLLVLLLAGGEAAGAAGDDTSSAAGEAGPAAPSPLALPGPAVSAGSPAAGSPPKALPALPTPLGPVERALRFPLGDPARARQLNNQGLQLQQRRLPGARESYQAAVLASAAYPWARFNLAGELAREGKLDGALEQLESLYLLGTVEAARALLQAEAAPELRSLWADPRLAPL